MWFFVLNILLLKNKIIVKILGETKFWIYVFMDYSVTGHGTPIILILEVGIPVPKFWCPKTDLRWIVTNKITIISKNSDQYFSFEGLHILLQLVEVGF